MRVNCKQLLIETEVNIMKPGWIEAHQDLLEMQPWNTFIKIKMLAHKSISKIRNLCWSNIFIKLCITINKWSIILIAESNDEGHLGNTLPIKKEFRSQKRYKQSFDGTNDTAISKLYWDYICVDDV